MNKLWIVYAKKRMAKYFLCVKGHIELSKILEIPTHVVSEILRKNAIYILKGSSKRQLVSKCGNDLGCVSIVQLLYPRKEPKIELKILSISRCAEKIFSF